MLKGQVFYHTKNTTIVSDKKDKFGVIRKGHVLSYTKRTTRNLCRPLLGTDLSRNHRRPWSGADLSRNHRRPMPGADISRNHLRPLSGADLSRNHLRPLLDTDLSKNHHRPWPHADLSRNHLRPMPDWNPAHCLLSREWLVMVSWCGEWHT